MNKFYKVIASERQFKNADVMRLLKEIETSSGTNFAETCVKILIDAHYTIHDIDTKKIDNELKENGIDLNTVKSININNFGNSIDVTYVNNDGTKKVKYLYDIEQYVK